MLLIMLYSWPSTLSWRPQGPKRQPFDQNVKLCNIKNILRKDGLEGKEAVNLSSVMAKMSPIYKCLILGFQAIQNLDFSLIGQLHMVGED